MLFHEKLTKLFVILVLSSLLNADEVNIDNLLTNIEKKTDLSTKTKLENGGISYIYTREDIQKMQAHNLKDILKSTYPFGYNENNFGISDPFAIQTATPFMSSKLKIYIDNQEISTGLYGSGLIIYGKMDIDFVDHIEVYAGNPTLEFSTEPAFTIIKLYSKVAQKDDGSKVILGAGSYASKEILGYTTSTLDNGWSYFTYASAIDTQRKEYENYDAQLSRDSKNIHLFGTLSKDKHHFIIDAIDINEDSFISVSTFATPNNSTLNNNFLHLGYDTKIDNLSFVLTFDKMDTKTTFEDLNKKSIKFINSNFKQNIPYAFNTNSKSEVYTTGINYDFQTSSNKLVLGAKYRLKHFKYIDINLNEQEVPKSGHSKQSTSTLFIENKYSLADNQILTAGVSCSWVRNNHSVQNDNLYTYRIGYTYTNSKLISKTVTSHIEVSLDPYLVNSSYLNNPYDSTPKEKQDVFMQDFKYKDKLNEYELVLSYMLIKDKLFPTLESGLLDAYGEKIKAISAVFRYAREYRAYDKLEISFGRNCIENSPQNDKLEQYATTLRNFNTISNFDIFNEILYYRDSMESKNYYDYSMGVIYHKNEDLSFSIKGTNLFDKAKTSVYNRVNPITFELDEPLRISPIDRKVMLRMGYTF